MEWKIIADSSCDMTEQLKERLEVMLVPFTMVLGKKEIVDDDSLDLPGFMAEMKACKEKIGSAAPSPHLFQEAIEKAVNSFIITLSSSLSASYSNAILGKKMAEENNPEINTYVFDSKSATAAEVLLAITLKEMIVRGETRENIINGLNRFIGNMKTYLVLDSYENLMKNGRLSKITEKLISILNIKLLMCADRDGNIQITAKPRGTVQMLDKMASLIAESGKETDGENIVITHCNNPGLAERLKELIEKKYNFKEIFVVPTKGLSSLYTDDKGIVMAF